MAGTIYQSNNPPVKGVAYTFFISLVSQADTDIFQKTVTLAAGDVKVYQDGVLDGNIDTLPVEIGATGVLNVTLSIAEMTADIVTVAFCDAAGDEWQDAVVDIYTETDQQTNIIAAIWAGVSAVWAYATRTLTSSAASTTATVSGSAITAHRGDTLTASLTGLGALTGYTSLWFTVKGLATQTDAESTIQIKKNTSGVGDGLLYINGAAATYSTDGSITIDDDAAGDITITLDESMTDDLAPNNYSYDVQVLNGGAVTTLTYETFTVPADVTRSIT